MNKRKYISCGLGLIGFLLTQPIWYYLLYQILIRVQATQLMMFLFWVYLPANIFINVVAKMLETGIIGEE